jgi:hypothetical protein
MSTYVLQYYRTQTSLCQAGFVDAAHIRSFLDQWVEMSQKVMKDGPGVLQ